MPFPVRYRLAMEENLLSAFAGKLLIKSIPIGFITVGLVAKRQETLKAKNVIESARRYRAGLGDAPAPLLYPPLKVLQCRSACVADCC